MHIAHAINTLMGLPTLRILTHGCFGWQTKPSFLIHLKTQHYHVIACTENPDEINYSAVTESVNQTNIFLNVNSIFYKCCNRGSECAQNKFWCE